MHYSILNQCESFRSREKIHMSIRETKIPHLQSNHNVWQTLQEEMGQKYSTIQILAPAG